MSSSKSRTELLNGVVKHPYAVTDEVLAARHLTRKSTSIQNDALSRHLLTEFSESMENMSMEPEASSKTNKKGHAEKAQSPAGDGRLVFPPIVQICDKKTEMRAMKAQLEDERLKYEDTYEDLKRQTDIIHQKENDFKELLMRHDATIQENLAKRKMARDQALRETQSKDDKDKQIALLKNEEEKLETRKESIRKDTENLQKYQDFMNQIWKASDGEFHDVTDIIDRFNRFQATFYDLNEREERNAVELEELKKLATSNYEKRNSEILELTNQLTSMQKEIEEMQEESRKWDSKLNQLQIASSNKNLLLGQITMGIDNLFFIINKYIRIRKGNEDTLTKLDKIESFMGDLWEIVDDVPGRVTDSKYLETFNREKHWYKSRDMASSDGISDEDEEAGRVGTPHATLPPVQVLQKRAHQIGGISATLAKALLKSKHKLGTQTEARSAAQTKKSSLVSKRQSVTSIQSNNP